MVHPDFCKLSDEQMGCSETSRRPPLDVLYQLGDGCLTQRWNNVLTNSLECEYSKRHFLLCLVERKSSNNNFHKKEMPQVYGLDKKIFKENS